MIKQIGIKPNYWIVSDFVEDHDKISQTKNKYDLTWNFIPNSNYSIDNNNKIAKTNFISRANVQLLSADKDVNVEREYGYFCPQYGVTTITDRMVFSKTQPVDEKVTFDTVVYPTKKGEQNVKVSVERLETGVPTKIASAMHISRDGKYNELLLLFKRKKLQDFFSICKVSIR